VRIYGEIAIATGTVSTIGGSDSKPKRTACTEVFICALEVGWPPMLKNRG
jgi:hypothetical protein